MFEKKKNAYSMLAKLFFPLEQKAFAKYNFKPIEGGTEKGKLRNACVMYMLVKFFSLSNPLKLCSDPFPARLCRPWSIEKDLTV